ncbi:hypothetical protein BKA69DRAFT_1065431 [Paraphysoderma sedebokerense]|nr:hypothetical protein BKA69DRAFT_1065431 [Paraphysoderma sedebokerense]
MASSGAYSPTLPTPALPIYSHLSDFTANDRAEAAILYIFEGSILTNEYNKAKKIAKEVPYEAAQSNYAAALAELKACVRVCSEKFRECLITPETVESLIQARMNRDQDWNKNIQENFKHEFKKYLDEKIDKVKLDHRKELDNVERHWERRIADAENETRELKRNFSSKMTALQTENEDLKRRLLKTEKLLENHQDQLDRSHAVYKHMSTSIQDFKSKQDSIDSIVKSLKAAAEENDNKPQAKRMKIANVDTEDLQKRLGGAIQRALADPAFAAWVGVVARGPGGIDFERLQQLESAVLQIQQSQSTFDGKRIRNIESSINQVKQDLHVLSPEGIPKLKSTIDTFRSHVQAQLRINDATDKLTRQISAMSSVSPSKSSSTQVNQTDIENLRRQCNNLSTRLTLIEKRIETTDDHGTRYQTLKQSVETLKDQFEHSRGAYDQTLKSIRGEIGNVNSSIAVLLADMKKDFKISGTLQTEIGTLSDRMNALEAKMNSKNDTDKQQVRKTSQSSHHFSL